VLTVGDFFINLVRRNQHKRSSTPSSKNEEKMRPMVVVSFCLFDCFGAAGWGIKGPLACDKPCATLPKPVEEKH